MPSFLSQMGDFKTVQELVEKAASADKIAAKFVKVGSFLPRWDITHPTYWGGTSIDMQAYLHEYLQQYGLDYQINGNNQIEVIAWP